MRSVLLASLTIALLAKVTCDPASATTTLHPGDKVSIAVFNHPELAVTSTTVDSAGNVSVPLAGLVPAADAAPGDLAERISIRLQRYVRKPAVDVQLIEQGQNIFVAGGPGGVLSYTPGETLSAALSQLQAGSGVAVAGAPSNADLQRSMQYQAIDLHQVSILRNGSTFGTYDAVGLQASGNAGPALQPDDTLALVDKPIAVKVDGDVKLPGTAHLSADEPLSDALKQAGGTNEMSATHAFVLTRDGSQQFVSTSTPAYSEPARSGDEVFVPHGRHVGVVGNVVKPGDVLLQGDGSLLSALYYAGGPTQDGDLRQVAVIHNGVQTKYDIMGLTHGQTADNPQLADGDTVFVPEGHRINFSLVFQAIIAASTLRFLL